MKITQDIQEFINEAYGDDEGTPIEAKVLKNVMRDWKRALGEMKEFLKESPDDDTTGKALEVEILYNIQLKLYNEFSGGFKPSMSKRSSLNLTKQ